MTYKKTLGRGLQSLIPGTTKTYDEDVDKNLSNELNDDVSKSNEVIKIDIDKIIPRDNQPRKSFKDEALIDLSNSIKEYGLLSPIVVMKVDDKYEIIAGERRYRASKLIDQKEIDAIVREFDEKDIEILSLVENVQREDLTALEEANAYKSLSENYNMTQEEIAKTMGKSRSYIANTMRLIKLNDMEKEALEDEKITSSQARSLLSIEEGEERSKTLEDFIHNRINIREVEEISKNQRNKKSVKDQEKVDKKITSHDTPDNTDIIYAPDIDDILVEDFEEQFMEELGSKVSINKTGEIYKVTIDCFSIEDIENLFGRIKDETD